MIAKRYNNGKLRFDLIPNSALTFLAEVYTKGAHKYTIYEDENGNKVKGSEIPFENLSNLNLKIVEDGANNWRKGLDWKSTMASVKRHIAAWDKGEDIDADPSMNTKNLANAAWGLFSLLEFYEIYPQGDNRLCNKFTNARIGLDIDEVICNFIPHYLKVQGLNEKLPTHWNDFRFKKKELWDKIKDHKDFWCSIPALINGSELPFEPICYITSRMIPTEWTEEWLEKNDFPTAPILGLTNGSKVEAAKKMGVNIFVEDNYNHFVELNNNGIFTYLMSASHNLKYNVGNRRISSLKMLK